MSASALVHPDALATVYSPMKTRVNREYEHKLMLCVLQYCVGCWSARSSVGKTVTFCSKANMLDCVRVL